MSTKNVARFGFRIYSARYGNIYTSRQLVQLAREALLGERPVDAIWRKGPRYFDALRPSAEPDGHGSAELVERHRDSHLAAVRRVFERVQVFVFTLGLTEHWKSRLGSTVYPMAPGVLCGEHDPDRYEFVNLTTSDVVNDFVEFRSLLKQVNSEVRFLLTVSPVSLTATATNHHVLAANTYSKAVLRAAAGQLYGMFDDIDYYPSFELIATPFARGFFYDANLRTVSDAAVRSVMRHFFDAHQPTKSAASAGRRLEKAKAATRVKVEETGTAEERGDVVCEEVLLQAFAPGSRGSR